MRGLAAPGRRLTSDGATSLRAQPLCARLSRHTQSGFSLNGTGSSLRQLLSSQPLLVQWLSGPPHRVLRGPQPPRRFCWTLPKPRPPQGWERASGQHRGRRQRNCSMGEAGLFVPLERGSGEMVEPEAPVSKPAAWLLLPR